MGGLLLMPFPKALDNAVSICRIKSDYIYGVRTLATKYLSCCSVLFVANEPQKVNFKEYFSAGSWVPTLISVIYHKVPLYIKQ